MVAVVLVLFIGFGTMFVAAASMLVDSYRDKKSTTLELGNQVKVQNDKIDALTKALNEQKTTQLSP